MMLVRSKRAVGYFYLPRHGSAKDIILSLKSGSLLLTRGSLRSSKKSPFTTTAISPKSILFQQCSKSLRSFAIHDIHCKLIEDTLLVLIAVHSVPEYSDMLPRYLSAPLRVHSRRNFQRTDHSLLYISFRAFHQPKLYL